MPEIVVIAHNIRSTHNIGSLFRTAEGFGVKHIYLTGYTPYPLLKNDPRLPHISQKLTKDIHKTALGAELLVPFSHREEPPVEVLRKKGYKIVGLEQNESSILLENYTSPERIALIIGEEVEGIPENLLKTCDDLLEIPMVGKKESFNVSVATGIALYSITR